MKHSSNNITFNDKARQYDSWNQTPFGALCDKLEKEAIFSLDSIQQDEFVLDVGCGTGNYLLELAERGARVVGVDTSPNMLEIARDNLKRRGYNFQLELAKADVLPFKDNSFDMVLSILVLEFVVSPQKVIREMFRVMKPGGRLVIGTLNKYSFLAYKRKLANALGLADHVRATYLTKKRLESLLLAEGDNNPVWRRAIYFLPFKKRLFLRMATMFESIGRYTFPAFGAFLAVKTNKFLKNGKGRK